MIKKIPKTRAIISRTTARKIIVWLVLTLAVFSVAITVTDVLLRVSQEDEIFAPDPKYYQNVMANDRVVALTFDDGPDPQKTKQITDILNKHQVPATFFFLGNQALKYPQIVEDTKRMGHEIGNHSFSHSPNVHQDKKRLQTELTLTSEILGSIIGEKSLLYRPPYLLDIGSDAVVDPADHSPVMDWVLEDGFIPVGADIDSLDWQAQSESDIVNAVLNNLDNGHIILLHDGTQGKFTTEALDTLIVELKKRDYRFETVSEVIGLNAMAEMLPQRDLVPNDTDETTNGSVSMLQTYLLKEGYYLEEPNGIFDQETEDALTSWQQSVSLPESERGVVSAATRDYMTAQLHLPPPEFTASREHIIKRLATYVETTQSLLVKLTAVVQGNLSFVTVTTIMLVFGRLVILSLLTLTRLVRPKKENVIFQKGVSIIIPAYNEEENISATIKSILETNRKKIEILVIDDGSTDSTSQKVLSLQKKFPQYIRYIKQENRGKAEALNQGVEAARYNVVITVDGDTIFTQDTISLLTRPLKDHSVAAVAGKVGVSSTKTLMARFQHLEYSIAQNIDKNAFSLINGISVVPGPIGAWRRSTLLRAGGFSTDTLVEDQDMTLALLKRKRKIVYQSQAVAFTETPHKLKDFIKQRARWVLGTIQCLNKYSFAFLNPRYPSLGFLVLPHTLIYSIILPLLYPLMDAMLLGWIFFGLFANMGWLVVLFMLLDIVYGLCAFISEKQKATALLWFPLQRIFYRVIVAYVVFLSLIRMLEGGKRAFKKVVKRGDAQKQFFLQISPATAN